MSGASVLVSSESRRGKMVVTGRGGSRHHLPMHRGSGVAGGGGTVATAVGGGGESIPGSSQRRMMSSGQQKGQSRGLHPMCCNRCRKPLSTTIFVCSCDCVFCEECTYGHFNTNSTCPTCNRTLSENDFSELAIADPSSSNPNRTSNFQYYFAKQNSETPFFAFQDICSRLLKQNDDLRAGTKFVMKQFLIESSRQHRNSSSVLHTLERLKQEYTALKQSHNSQRIKYETAIGNLQQQLASAQKKIEEKDRQLMQFRQLHGAMTPASPRVATGGGSSDRRRVDPQRFRGDNVPTSSSQQQRGGHQQQGVAPPMKGFMIQKEAQERAKQRALEGPQRRAPILGAGSRNDGMNSNSRGMPGQQYYSTPAIQNQQRQQQRPFSNGSGGGSVGIRDFTSSYSFSGGSGKRRRGRSPSATVNPSSGYPQQHSRGLSPSQAFAAQPPGSYSVNRGPSAAFQQHAYGRK